MCGIAFVSDLNERTAEACRILAYGIRHRGGDSWGMTNGRISQRELGPITRTFRVPGPDWYGRPLLIHTRAATVGKVSVENCHPFDITGKVKRVQGIHNGSLSNWEDMNKKYDRTLEVDSAHTFAHIADGLPTGELRMRGIVAWLEDDSPIVHFARSFSTDIHVVRLMTGEVIGCSTSDPVRMACEVAGLEVVSTYKIPDNDTHYIVRPWDATKDKGVEPKEGEESLEGKHIVSEVGPMPFCITAQMVGYVSGSDADDYDDYGYGWHGYSYPQRGSHAASHVAKSQSTSSGSSFSSSGERSSAASKDTTARGGRRAGGGTSTDKVFRFKLCAQCRGQLSQTAVVHSVLCLTCYCGFLDESIAAVRTEVTKTYVVSPTHAPRLITPPITVAANLVAPPAGDRSWAEQELERTAGRRASGGHDQKIWD